MAEKLVALDDVIFEALSWWFILPRHAVSKRITAAVLSSDWLNACRIEAYQQGVQDHAAITDKAVPLVPKARKRKAAK